MKKAQLEIMGLAIVIILVMMGVLFAIRFVLLKPPSTVKQEFTQSQLVSNFGTALLQSTTQDCKGIDMTELLTDCAEFQSITCDNGMRTCRYANTTIKKILNQTFDVWRVKYHVKAFTDPAFSLVDIHSPNCNDNMPGGAESFFLPTSRGTGGVLTFKIYVCE